MCRIRKHRIGSQRAETCERRMNALHTRAVVHPDRALHRCAKEGRRALPGLGRWKVHSQAARPSLLAGRDKTRCGKLTNSPGKRHRRVAEFRKKLRRFQFIFPLLAQQSGDEDCLRGRSECGHRCVPRLTEVLPKIDAKIRQVELIAGYNERHLLFDEPLSLIRSQRPRREYHWALSNVCQLTELNAQSAQRSYAFLARSSQQNLLVTQIHLVQIESVLQKVRQFPSPPQCRIRASAPNVSCKYDRMSAVR